MDPVLLTYVPAGASVQFCVPFWLLNDPDAQGIQDRSWYDDRYVPASNTWSVHCSTQIEPEPISRPCVLCDVEPQPCCRATQAHAVVLNRRASSGPMLVFSTTSPGQAAL